MLLVMKLAVLHLSQYDTIFLVMQLSVAARKRETGLTLFISLGFGYENADV